MKMSSRSVTWSLGFAVVIGMGLAPRILPAQPSRPEWLADSSRHLVVGSNSPQAPKTVVVTVVALDVHDGTDGPFNGPEEEISVNVRAGGCGPVSARCLDQNVRIGDGKTNRRLVANRKVYEAIIGDWPLVTFYVREEDGNPVFGPIGGGTNDYIGEFYIRAAADRQSVEVKAGGNNTEDRSPTKEGIYKGLNEYWMTGSDAQYKVWVRVEVR